jgi:hypothetical protein
MNFRQVRIQSLSSIHRIHKGLLTILRSIGIQGPLLSWIENYLLDRKQMVAINDCCSDWRNVCAGVPQTSILGLCSFLFISDQTLC